MIFNSLGGVLAASLLALSLGTGCESDGGHAKGTHTMPDGTTMADTSNALMCPKCETVWIANTVDQGLKSQRLVSKREMKCEMCDKMAESYIKDGEKALHECADCKTTPVAVKRQKVVHLKGSHG
jgi:hypothetical protein